MVCFSNILSRLKSAWDKFWSNVPYIYYMNSTVLFDNNSLILLTLLKLYTWLSVVGNVLQILKFSEMLQWISNWIQYNWTKSIPLWDFCPSQFTKEMIGRFFERELSKKKRKRERDWNVRMHFMSSKSHIWMKNKKVDV